MWVVAHKGHHMTASYLPPSPCLRGGVCWLLVTGTPQAHISPTWLPTLSPLCRGTELSLNGAAAASVPVGAGEGVRIRHHVLLPQRPSHEIMLNHEVGEIDLARFSSLVNNKSPKNWRKHLRP